MSTDAPAWFQELAGFLRIPSISADPAHAGDVRAAAEWVCQFIGAAGGDAGLVAGDPHPLAIGELRATAAGVDPEKAPTVLCYGHFDVQPADPLELWESGPFEPEIRDGQLYARGAADDKAPLYMLLAAARELSAAGELGVNVRFACDGEEEIAGQSVVRWVQDDARGADAGVIFDTEMVTGGRAQFHLACRGIAYFHLTVRTGERDLHSGIYGGAALNAAHVLTRILGSLLAVDGRLAEPLRAGLVPPTATEVANWTELPAGAAVLAELGGRPADATAAADYYTRTFVEPALDVNGLFAGSPHQVKTVLPVTAEANVSIRLAPGQEPAAVIAAFARLVAEATPDGAQADVEVLTSAAPAVVDPDARGVRLIGDAFERTLGARPLLTRTGGSLPVLAALSEAGIPTVLTGFTLPDANMHAPNERIPVDHVELGIATARELLRELASL